MRNILKFVLLLLCSACAIGPNYKKKQIYSDEKITNELNINNIGEKSISADWFRQFSDPYLNQLIEKSLKNSPNIIKAKEKLYQARHNLYIAQADLLPEFDFSSDYTKSAPAKVIEPMAKQDYFQVGFDASWEIDIWGGKRRLAESQMAMLKSVGADFNNIKLMLISEIVAKYINWRLFQKLVEVTNRNIENQTEIFMAIKDKYDAGLVDELTLNQAESLLKSTKQKLPKYIINEKNMLNSLAVLIGILPSEIDNKNNVILENKFSFNTADLYNLSAQNIRMRPDIFAAEQNLIAQNALIGNKMSNLLPSLSLKTFLGFQNNTLSPIIGKDYNMYSNNAASVLPILHWGKIVNDIKIQESATREAFEVYKVSVLQGIVDISNAIKSVEENIKNNILADENSLLYQNIADLSKQKYESGLIAFNDYLSAEQDKISAQAAKYQAMSDVLVSIVSFYKAVGGGLSANYNVPDDRTVLKETVDEPCTN